MLSEMSWEQFLGWTAYTRLEPWGEERSDLRCGIIASVIANVNRDPKRKATPYNPSDFMPKFGEKARKKPLTDVEEWNRVKQSARVMAK